MEEKGIKKLLKNINTFIETTLIKFLIYSVLFIWIFLEYKANNYNNYYLSILLLFSIFYILVVKFLSYFYEYTKDIKFVSSQFKSLNSKELSLILSVYNQGTAYASPEHSDVIKNLISKKLIKPIIEDYLNTYPVSLTNKCIKFLESKHANTFLQQYNINLLENK